jgi:mannitol/fructose-specific phosphotransferase system IIA component (Ntr-type)
MERFMKLSDYLPEKHITIGLKGTRKIEIIEELLKLMQQLDLVQDYETALNDILSREGYLSTGLENGLAIPHAKTKGMSELAMVFGISKNGVEFETLDGKPAHMIFLVLSPVDTSGPHIQALALISRNLKNAAVRSQIINASTEKEVAEIFNSFS